MATVDFGMKGQLRGVRQQLSGKIINPPQLYAPPVQRITLERPVMRPAAPAKTLAAPPAAKPGLPRSPA
jgi:hypothetical protein